MIEQPPKSSLFQNPEFWGGVICIVAGVTGGLYLILRALYSSSSPPKIITTASSIPTREWRPVNAMRGPSTSAFAGTESRNTSLVVEPRADDTAVAGVDKESVSAGGQSARDRYRAVRLGVDGQDKGNS